MVQTLGLEKAVKEAQRRGVLRSGSHSGIAVLPLKVTPGRGQHLSVCINIRSLHSRIAPFQEGSRVLSTSLLELYPRVPSVAH